MRRLVSPHSLRSHAQARDSCYQAPDGAGTASPSPRTHSCHLLAGSRPPRRPPSRPAPLSPLLTSVTFDHLFLQPRKPARSPVFTARTTRP